MSRFHIFFAELSEAVSGFRPVKASYAFEAEQIIQREFPGAWTATLSKRVTDKEEIWKLFMEGLGKI